MKTTKNLYWVSKHSQQSGQEAAKCQLLMYSVFFMQLLKITNSAEIQKIMDIKFVSFFNSFKNPLIIRYYILEARLNNCNYK